MLLMKFYSVDSDILYSLFNSFCASFYGSELWVNFPIHRNFRQISVSYHNEIKKILGLPKFYSNHFMCSIFNAFTFEHFLNFRRTKFMFWLRRCSSPCFYLHKSYFTRHSYFVQKVDNVWQCKYGATDFLDNDLQALISRILYVQQREQSSMNFMIVS